MTDFVKKYYEMDPETEDVLFDSSYLRNEMRVLIESPDLRGIPGENLDDWALDEIRLLNRWCEVSFLKFDGDYVHFIAIYDDGIKRKRTYPIPCAWIVKKNSIPEEVDDEPLFSEEDFVLPSDVVVEMRKKVVDAMEWLRYEGIWNKSVISNRAEEAVREILRIAIEKKLYCRTAPLD